MDISMNYSMTNNMESSVSFTGEESSWTSYFVDFIVNGNENNENDSFLSSSSSMVKEANRLTLRNRSHGSDQLGHRRRKIRTKYVDQDLEDTASSPVQSPKVDNSNYNGQNDQLEDNSVSCFQDNKHTRKEGENIDDDHMSIIEAELKRKGLCLVPMSMLLNHLK